MLDLTQFVQQLTPRRRGLAEWIAVLASRLGLGTFSSMNDAKLVDHHWAAESALCRAVRLGQVQIIAELGPLVESMEREMRHRGMM